VRDMIEQCRKTNNNKMWPRWYI